MRTAEAESAKAVGHRDAASRASAKVATATKKLHKADADLENERQKAQAKAAEKTERSRKQTERDREVDERRRRQREAAHDREFKRLREHTTALEAQIAAEPWTTAPVGIRVLFIAASPVDEVPLRLDKEVREIQRRMRESEYRDSVAFEFRLATQVTDLLQALNEVRPHVVHFSGHSSEGALVLEDYDGRSKPLYVEDLAQLLRISSDRIRLAVFNSCHSSGAAVAACDFVPFAIGMNEPVNDTFAQVFAGQFYNAVGFGKSIRDAFSQALWQAKAATGRTSGDPELHSAPESDPGNAYLVRPAA